MCWAVLKSPRKVQINRLSHSFHLKNINHRTSFPSPLPSLMGKGEEMGEWLYGQCFLNHASLNCWGVCIVGFTSAMKSENDLILRIVMIRNLKQ